MKSITLCSTVVVPSFDDAMVTIRKMTKKEFVAALKKVTRNLCGHPVTSAVLRAACPTLPESERAFWNGDGIAIAARPKGGVRNGRENEAQITIDDLEFCKFIVRRGNFSSLFCSDN